jgi:hypothetical protein
MKQKKLLSLLLAVCMVLALLPTVAAAETTEVTDVLTADKFVATSTQYKDFSGVSVTSDAVYAGNSAKASDGAIQLRSNNNNSGIVTTVSGGQAAKVVVAWNSNTSTGNRQLDIYGKNTAYSSAADLYDSSNQGTLIGSIVCDTDTEIQIGEGYQYIGLRSKNGAMYLDSIEITWLKDGDTPQPVTYTVSFDANGGSGTMADATTTGSYTLPACTFTAPEGKEFDCWKIDGDNTEYAVGDTVTIEANTTFVAQWKDLPVVTYTDMMLKRAPSNGDVVVIYYPTAGKVMTGEDYLYNNTKHELVAADATLTDDVLAVPDEAIRLTVTVDENGKYTFATTDGKYLLADGTNVQLVDEQGANTLFQLETAAAGTDNYYIKCDSAVYSDKAQYIEYYGGYFTVYGMGTNTAIFTFQFFSEDGEGPTPAVTYTVSFDANGGSGTMDDVTDATSPYTLPECTFTAPEGMEFDCWKIDGDDTEYAVGAQVAISANTTFVAQWKEKPVSDEKTYAKVTEEPEDWSGEYLIVYEDGGIVFDASRETLDAGQNGVLVSIEDGTITTDSKYSFTIAAVENGYSILSSSNQFIGQKDYANGLKASDTYSEDYLNTIALDENGNAVISGTGVSENVHVALKYNKNTGATNERFRYYKSGQQSIALYKLVEEEPVELSDGFYLIGPDWTVNAIDAADKFGENMEAGGELILAATLAEGDEIKVVKVANNAITAWYPDGIDTQYTVDAAHAGNVNIYFRETYTNDWAAFGGYFYIEAGHNIICASAEHGLVSTTHSRAAAGTTITVNIEPEEGYALDTLTVMCGETAVETTKVNDEKYTFVMPAGDVTITATFAIPVTEPYFRGQNLILEGLIGVSFNMELPAISGVDYATSYMTFSVEHGDCTERVDYTGNNSFICYVNAIQMAEPITATFHYTQNGTEKTVEKTYSVMDYIAAYEANKNLFDATTQALIEALADYGHHVQIFLSEQRGWVLGTDFAEMTAVYTENYSADTVSSVKTAVAAHAAEKTLNDDTEKITFSLILDSAIEIRVFFKMKSGYTGSFEVNDPYTAANVSGRYQVSVLNIPAHQLSETYTINAVTDNGTASITLSALSYVNSMLNAYTSTSAVNAAAAIYAYSQAADAYKNAH